MTQTASNLDRMIDEICSVLGEKVTGFDNLIIEGSKPSFAKMLVSDSSKRRLNLPAVYVYDEGFIAEQVGLGSAFGISHEERREEFSGDGKQVEFTFYKNENNKERSKEKETVKRYPIVRPIIGVEIAGDNNTNKNVQDAKRGKGAFSRDKLLSRDYDSLIFRVNYNKPSIIFRNPPPKGVHNIAVRYLVRKAIGETRGLRLKVHCFIDIYAEKASQCNAIAEEIMKALIEQDTLSHMSSIGIKIYIPSGAGIREYDGDSADHKKESLAYWRRLIYNVEVDLRTTVRPRPIEEIYVQRRGEEDF